MILFFCLKCLRLTWKIYLFKEYNAEIYVASEKSWKLCMFRCLQQSITLNANKFPGECLIDKHVLGSWSLVFGESFFVNIEKAKGRLIEETWWIPWTRRESPRMLVNCNELKNSYSMQEQVFLSSPKMWNFLLPRVNEFLGI